ncbi:MAG TPA: sulfatase-like hydrolase/transferase [Anaerolineae bacterium]|nr:sulfatase-like hydrolase/transferase [Anaerolineae bacterium]
MSKWLPHALIIMVAGFNISVAYAANEIVHDAEYYVLDAQLGDKWAKEDKSLDAKLEELRKKYGKPPNIIHIMWDDTPVGEIGIPEIQKVRGWETPNLNQLAGEGINFMRMYTQPSCTPSRAAVLTGRLAVRNGMYNVGFPYEHGGLAADEVTMAEVLSKAGYATAFFGKSHLGDVESSYMNRQGFDEALWTPYNQAASLYVPQAQLAVLSPAVLFPEMFGEDPYDIDKGWRPRGYVWALEGNKGGPVREVGKPPNHDDYVALEGEFWKRASDFIHRKAKGDKPFYVALWPQVTSFLGFPDRVTASGGMLQEGLARMDARIGKLIAELKELGIAENTLVVLMADNGPMTHNGPPGMVETLYRGGKGDFTEGGVRVPAIAWWPGVIKPGQVSGDIIDETDLFTTFARLGGATEYIPTDRIIDGVDQTALLLEGDTHSRRDYVFIYTGNILAAIVKGRYKRHLVGAQPGLSGPEFYDLYTDPREANGKMLPMFPAKGMFSLMKTRHLMWKENYPDKGQNRDFPLKGIENARPETIEATKPRIDPAKVPFDPRAAIKRVPEWDNLDKNWGVSE